MFKVIIKHSSKLLFYIMRFHVTIKNNKRTHMKKILGILTIIFFLQSCYYDKEEILYPTTESDCNSTNSDFASVKLIVQENCLSCHSNSSANTLGGSVKLEDFNDIKNYADNGKLLGSIKHKSSYSAMPKNGAKLSDCKISQIENWINSGTPNN